MKATKTIDRAENILRLSKSVNIYWNIFGKNIISRKWTKICRISKRLRQNKLAKHFNRLTY